MAIAIANRYASALADVITGAESPVAEKTILKELRGFQGLLKSSGELRNVLDTPAVIAASKRRLIGRIADHLALSVTTRNFLYVVIDHRRLILLDEIIDALEEWLDKHSGVTRITITTAQPIAAEQQDALVAKFSDLNNCKTVAKFAVSPALVGGVTVRFGSTIFDGSLQAQLNNLGRILSGES